jgi:hypothetical protein
MHPRAAQPAIAPKSGFNCFIGLFYPQIPDTFVIATNYTPSRMDMSLRSTAG